MKIYHKKLAHFRNSKEMTQKELADACYVARTTYQNWESGITSPKILSIFRLCTVLNLKPFNLIMEVDDIPVDEIKYEWDKYQTENKNPLSEIAPVSAKIKDVPIISMAKAACYHPNDEPLYHFAENNCVGKHIFPNATDTQVCVQIDGDSMSPELHHGSIVLVETAEYPQRGDIVVAWLRDHGVVCKYYHIKNHVVTLSSENPEGETFTWNNKTDPTYCYYMKPVVQQWSDSRKRRWEKFKNGKI